MRLWMQVKKRLNKMLLQIHDWNILVRDYLMEDIGFRTESVNDCKLPFLCTEINGCNFCVHLFVVRVHLLHIFVKLSPNDCIKLFEMPVCIRLSEISLS